MNLESSKPDRCKGCYGYDNRVAKGFIPADSISKPVDSLKFAFMGECGGSTEALTSIPFSGNTGDELNRVFEIVGVSRDHVLLDNTFRCQPKDNKYPTGKRAEMMLTHCRQWDQAIDRYNPTVAIICYHPTFALIYTPSARFTIFNAVRKALRLHSIGERPIILAGQKAVELILPSLPYDISRWADGKHLYIEWQKSGNRLDVEQFKTEIEKRSKARGPSLRDLLNKSHKPAPLPSVPDDDDDVPF